MSIHSIMTATLPPNSPHYGHSSHQAYNTMASYPANNSLPNGSSRLAPSYSFPNNTHASVPQNAATSSSRQIPQSNNMTNSQSTSALEQNSRKRERRPDWHEFYKNGVPKEIIVIEDDSPQPPPRKENDRSYHQPTQSTMGGGEPTNKKRRTGQTSTYDTAREQNAYYSHARTYSTGNTGSDTISTDRTTSLQTTAPTSLGSHTSHGSSGTYLEDSVVGQKRKRVTRQQTEAEKKKKEIEVVGDAYSAYQPPPKPPIKAGDVRVPSIRDVRFIPRHVKTLLRPNQVVTTHDKIDDDDGHYIVTEDMPIGDRCEFPLGNEL